MRSLSGRRRLLRYAVRLTVACPLLYMLAAAIGLFPANRGFRSTPDGFEVYVTSNGAHTGIVLPSKTAVMNWETLFPGSDFPSRSVRSHIEFGWGDRQFYIETPTWSEVRSGSVLRSSLWPTSATMHVMYLSKPRESSRCRRIALQSDQFRRLVQELRGDLALGLDGKPIQIADAGYGSWDAFYEARGSYHLFNTCNSWTGRTLRRSGVKVGIWTPFPYSVMQSLGGD